MHFAGCKDKATPDLHLEALLTCLSLSFILMFCSKLHSKCTWKGLSGSYSSAYHQLGKSYWFSLPVECCDIGLAGGLRALQGLPSKSLWARRAAASSFTFQTGLLLLTLQLIRVCRIMFFKRYKPLSKCIII